MLWWLWSNRIVNMKQISLRCLSAMLFFVLRRVACWLWKDEFQRTWSHDSHASKTRSDFEFISLRLFNSFLCHSSFCCVNSFSSQLAGFERRCSRRKQKLRGTFSDGKKKPSLSMQQCRTRKLVFLLWLPGRRAAFLWPYNNKRTHIRPIVIWTVSTMGF